MLINSHVHIDHKLCINLTKRHIKNIMFTTYLPKVIPLHPLMIMTHQLNFMCDGLIKLKKNEISTTKEKENIFFRKKIFLFSY